MLAIGGFNNNPYFGASSALDQITTGELAHVSSQNAQVAGVFGAGDPNSALLLSTIGGGLQGLGYNKWSYNIQLAKALLQMGADANKLAERIN